MYLSLDYSQSYKVRYGFSYLWDFKGAQKVIFLAFENFVFQNVR